MHSVIYDSMSTVGPRDFKTILPMALSLVTSLTLLFLFIYYYRCFSFLIKINSNKKYLQMCKKNNNKIIEIQQRAPPHTHLVNQLRARTL